MRAVVIEPAETRARLALRELDRPAPGPNEVLVRVRAAGLNRADALQRMGLYPTRAGAGPLIGGLEMAGEIEAVGEAVVGWKPGERVMSMAAGAYADFVAVDHRLLLPVPDGMAMVEAAACPVIFLTAHNAVVTAAGLRAGETVLVNAASSGAGLAALQIAALYGGAPVIAGSRRADKLARLGEFGAGASVETARQGWREDVLALSQGRGADVIVDHVGAGQIGELIEAAALGGRIVSVGRLGGTRDEVDLDRIAYRRVSLIGVTFRTRGLAQRAEVVRRFRAEAYDALADGRLRPLVHRTYSLEDVAQAQDDMLKNDHIGKLVLSL